MAGTYSNLLYHLVFSTRNRMPYINDIDFEKRLHEYLGGSIRGNNGVPYAINGTADHIHILFRWIPNGNLSNLMRDVKSQSSKWVHETFTSHKDFAWQEGFGAFSVSFSEMGRVKNYLAGQKNHHEKINFQDEFRTFLKRHRIEWDENTIWL